MRFRSCVVTAVLLAFPVLVAAQQTHKVYLDPNDYFSAYFSSALQKKKVPITVTMDRRQADYTVRFLTDNNNGSFIEGITRAMNNGGMYNAGASSQVTISVIDVRSKDVVFSYTCRKPNRYSGDDPSTITSVAECLAKHWKNNLH